MNTDLSELRKRTVFANEYIEKLGEPFRGKFMERARVYCLDVEAVGSIKDFRNHYFLLAFSAEWCKDCAANIPILALLSNETALETRVFGGIKKDPLSHTKKWRIPPSPPEVETFKVEKLPTIIVFDTRGREIGRVIENPKQSPNLERELLHVMISKHDGHSSSGSST